MTSRSKLHRLSILQERLRRAPTLSTDLMHEVIAQAGPRFHAHPPNAKAELLRLVDANAFTDATLALLRLELPQWNLRRLVHDDGQWHCALSRCLQAPIELDDSAEATHEALALAMVSALVEARRHSLMVNESRRASVPKVQSTARHVIICSDNFA